MKRKQKALILRKMKVLIFLFIFLSCANRENPAGPTSEKNISGTSIRGAVSGLLTRALSPYTVIDDIYVEAPETLTIEPGVEIIFSDSTELRINGTIQAVGSVTSRISLTAKENSWRGIRLENSNHDNIFSYCDLSEVEVTDYRISEFGALAILNSTAMIRNCEFRNNITVNGGGISIVSSEAKIKNNIFINNMAITFGGAIISIESITEIHNNTIYHNESENYGGGLVLMDPLSDDIQNNIFYLNSSQTGDPRISLYSGNAANYLQAYNFLWQGQLNPLFISGDNLHLQTGSPCIDMGNPDNRFNDANGSRNDQGAYGGPFGNW